MTLFDNVDEFLTVVSRRDIELALRKFCGISSRPAANFQHTIASKALAKMIPNNFPHQRIVLGNFIASVNFRDTFPRNPILGINVSNAAGLDWIHDSQRLKCAPPSVKREITGARVPAFPLVRPAPQRYAASTLAR